MKHTVSQKRVECVWNVYRMRYLVYYYIDIIGRPINDCYFVFSGLLYSTTYVRSTTKNVGERFEDPFSQNNGLRSFSSAVLLLYIVIIRYYTRACNTTFCFSIFSLFLSVCRWKKIKKLRAFWRILIFGYCRIGTLKVGRPFTRQPFYSSPGIRIKKKSTNKLWV